MDGEEGMDMGFRDMSRVFNKLTFAFFFFFLRFPPARPAFSKVTVQFFFRIISSFAFVTISVKLPHVTQLRKPPSPCNILISTRVLEDIMALTCFNFNASGEIPERESR